MNKIIGTCQWCGRHLWSLSPTHPVCEKQRANSTTLEEPTDIDKWLLRYAEAYGVAEGARQAFARDVKSVFKENGWVAPIIQQRTHQDDFWPERKK